ncbi:RagB/SusD family nutrient uptake outer membrane protein [Flavisolibacter sp. BT320]|nr:RagB/SusD family nutrient uptake outer membrane protein [Flavisolibacter longurius]
MSNKRIKYVGFILGVPLAASLIFVACKRDFLNQETIGVLTEAEAQSAKGARQFLTSTYAALKGSGWEGGVSNWVYGSIVGGDANKGSDAGDQADIVPIQQLTATPTNNYFNVKWRSLYEGIARANATIRVTSKLTDKDISAAEKTQILAQARFLRGFYHFEAKKMWDNIPYVDETIEAANAKVGNSKDWTRIMEDLDFARKNLNAVQDQVGKVNKWAGEAYYAKALLFQGKYAEALPILTDVVNNGKTSRDLKYNLAPAFHDLFNADKDNDPTVRAESVFAYEASINDGSGGLNANYEHILNFPYNGGPGGCCGFFQPTFELVNSFRTSATGLPLLDGSYNVGANQVKNDQGLESSSTGYTPDGGNLDPRLDWTVGRRGIPYLDWGLHPGKSWIRDQGFGGPFAPKKNVYYKAQEGKLTDGTNWTSGLTATNYKIMRFADVLLMAAEAEVEAGSLEKAREYVNRVRTRAAVGRVKDAAGNDAANYVISNYTTAWTNKDVARQAVRFERKLELAMEGHRFFDLVRWGVADQAINAFLTYEKTKLPTPYGAATFTKGKHEYFPIPQRQIDLSSTGGQSTLTQNPGYQ